jgi:hypothetical protein
VSKAAPVIHTRASLVVSVERGVHDTAFLHGGSRPTGNIAFSLHGPSDLACTSPPVFTTHKTVIGNGAYRSSTFVPRQAGTYRWVVTYSGDANNAGFSTRCGNGGEIVVVPRRLPVLTTSASPPANVLPKAARARATGLSIYDAAKLRLGVAPTGEITFTLFGPGSPTCSGTPVFTSITAVNGNGVYNSLRFTPVASGTYRWMARYSGDANNRPVLTACGARNEQVSVTVPAVTGLTTSASAAVTLGGAIHDTAHLSSGAAPTGMITFRLYDSGDNACAGRPVFTSTVPVDGSGDYVSGSFVPTAPGVYRWVVQYSGDHANHPAGPTDCGDGAERGIVRPTSIIPVVPALSTTASEQPPGGGTLSDIANLSGGIDPSGAITFELFGPDDQACAGPPVFTSVVSVTGNGSHRSASFAVAAPGTYRWVVTYSGDAVNAPIAPTTCGERAETSSVSSGLGPTPDPGPNVPPAPKPRPRPKPPPPPPPLVTG